MRSFTPVGNGETAAGAIYNTLNDLDIIIIIIIIVMKEKKEKKIFIYCIDRQPQSSLDSFRSKSKWPAENVEIIECSVIIIVINRD